MTVVDSFVNLFVHFAISGQSLEHLRVESDVLVDAQAQLSHYAAHSEAHIDVQDWIHFIGEDPSVGLLQEKCDVEEDSTEGQEGDDDVEDKERQCLVLLLFDDECYEVVERQDQLQEEKEGYEVRKGQKGEQLSFGKAGVEVFEIVVAWQWLHCLGQYVCFIQYLDFYF